MGLRIKSIRIEGMHNVVDKTYDFKDCTYLFGANGAGKSTVLQAVQLALLGYIPGYAKTNDGIFKHARSKMMCVGLTLVNDEGTEYFVQRSWVKQGQTVTSKTESDALINLPALIGNLELPIFNFSDFTSLSANKLKEWFITFLPNAGDDIHWLSTLENEVKDMELIDKNLVMDTVKEINAIESRSILKGAELVKGVNDMLKDKQQFYKGEIDALNKTIQSLVFYHDVADEEEEPIVEKIQALDALKLRVVQFNEAINHRNKISAQLASIEVGASSYDNDPEVPALAKTRLELTDKIKEGQEALGPMRAEFEAARAEVAKYTSLANSTGLCPYTKEECETAKGKIKEANDMFSKASSKAAELLQKMSAIEKEINEAQAELEMINRKDAKLKQNYQQSEMLQSMLTDLPEDPCRTLEDITEELNELRTKLSKIQINKKYNATVDQFTKDKYKCESSLEAIKAWVKVTGPNGLQTQLMSGPFNELAADMNKYLTDMFQTPTECRFNLSEKANSFSFGLMRGENYITFDTLSSGEKCLYTIALMACILDRSDSAIKVLIIDDLVDHLDDANAEFTFKSLLNLKDIQLIMAGVKPCNVKEMRVDI